MTNKFKEINLKKEFEYNDYELDLVTNADTITLICRFCYYPSSLEIYEIQGQCINWQKEAYVDLIEVKDYEKDLFDLFSESVIVRIEQQILEDLLQ